MGAIGGDTLGEMDLGGSDEGGRVGLSSSVVGLGDIRIGRGTRRGFVITLVGR